MSFNKENVERMLINATQEEEVRIALTSKDQYLENLFIEEFGRHRTGNIYKGKITRVVPSLQAAFVDYGSERHGFLPLKEVSPEYFRTQLTEVDGNHYSIADVLKEGQEIIVQVEKEERGNKGAALTSFITLAGCYLVLMPNNPRAGGISRRIDGEEREALKALLNALNIPSEMGLIVRTAGVGKAPEELQWDLDILLKLWEAIKAAGESQASPCLIHEESDVVIRAFRDYLRKGIDEIIIDNVSLYNRAKNHLSKIRPEIVDNVKLYQDKAIPLFSRYHIENQIETAFKRDVRLPSGGSIVIQETEALVSIDVNSARDTKSDDIEKTAFNTNREAAIEVARQLRLRDLGGLIVIDFIDMTSTDRQQQVVDIFKEEIKNDRARVQYNRISRFGLLEVSRQRLRPSLREASQIVCPRCDGLGSIRNIESLALFILRLIRHESMKDSVVEIITQLPIEVASFLLNEKRHVIDEIEHHHKVLVRVIPNPHIQTPEYSLERIYGSQSGQAGKISYEHIKTPELNIVTNRTNQQNKRTEPVVKELDTPAKPVTKRKKISLLKKLANLFSVEDTTQNQRPNHKHKRHQEQKGQQKRHKGRNNQRHRQQQNRTGQKNRNQQQRGKNQPRQQEHRQSNQSGRQERHDNRGGNKRRNPRHQEKKSINQTQPKKTTTKAPEVNVVLDKQTAAKTPLTTPAKTAKKTAVKNDEIKSPAVKQEKKPVFTTDAKLQPITETDKLEIAKNLVVKIQKEEKPGDKARKFHKKLMADKKKNPHKYKAKTKTAANKEVEK